MKNGVSHMFLATYRLDEKDFNDHRNASQACAGGGSGNPQSSPEGVAADLEEASADVEFLLLKAPYYFVNKPLNDPLIVQSYDAILDFVADVFEI